MPFTFAHPAIVLPLKHLKKNWFSLTGLIAGSMAPDFEYFFRMKVSGIYGHTFAGIFYFDLPVAILISVLFHGLVRNPLIDNLPSFFQKRFAQFKDFNFQKYFKSHFIVVLISILIGTASHLFWDSFTHPNGYFVDKINMLKESITVVGFKIKYFRLFQHLSTLFGTLFILFFIFKMPAANAQQVKISFGYWLTIFGVAFVIFLSRFIFLFLFHENELAVFLVAGNIIATIISGLLIGLVFAGGIKLR